MGWYLQAMSRFADFGGRSRRREYWFFALFYLIGSVIISVAEAILGLEFAMGWGPLSALFWLVHFLPGLAVTIRRLHDTGRSGWWILIALVPILGAIVLIVFMLLDSEPGVNEWGPSPKGPRVVVQGAE